MRRFLLLFYFLIFSFLSQAQSVSLVKDLNLGIGGSFPGRYIELNGEILFAAQKDILDPVPALWKTDGTAAGTFVVKDIATPTSFAVFSIDNMTKFNNQIFFTADDGINGPELWKSDGTTAGTHLVKDIAAGPFNFEPPKRLIPLNGKLYFFMDDMINGTELWESDGTSAGTVLVIDIHPTLGSIGAFTDPHAAKVGNFIYFKADEGLNGFELWRTDGTSAGTVLVKDINPTGSSNPTYMTDFNGTLIFVADDGVNGKEFWKSDGTSAGTVMIKDLSLGALSSEPIDLVVSGNNIFARNSGGGDRLYKTDGTNAGTIIVKNFSNASGGINNLTDANGTLFFSAVEIGGAIGNELWKSDGTNAGTVLVKDIRPAGNSNPIDFTGIGSTVFFGANDGVHGLELWKSDGTNAGTVMVADIYMGPNSGYSFGFEGIGILPSTMQGFFSAFTPTFGDELWSIDLAGFPLPVELISFQAQKINNKNVKLQWEISEAQNLQSFILEKSQNGKDFQPFAQVDFSTQNFNYLDENPFSGKNYYRLKMLDYDGKIEYSEIIIVEIIDAKLVFQVYPNPVKDILNIQVQNFDFTKEIQLNITNPLGEIVLQKTLNNPNEAVLVQNLNHGIYFLNLKSNNETITQKIFIN